MLTTTMTKDTKISNKQFEYIRRSIPNFIDKEFPKVKENHHDKGNRGIAIVAVTLFMHYLRANQK